MEEVDDFKQSGRGLGFNKEGLYDHLDESVTDTYDSMGKQYHRCPKCKKFYPVEGWPTDKRNGKLTKLCVKCHDAALVAKKKYNEAHKKPVKAQKAAVKKAKTTTTKVSQEAKQMKFDITSVSDSDLIKEMSRRGWKGSVDVVTHFDL